VLCEELHQLVPIRFTQPPHGRQNTQLSQPLSQLRIPLIDVNFSWHNRYLGLHSTVRTLDGQARQTVFACLKDMENDGLVAGDV
jgi:hypothetical protein